MKIAVIGGGWIGCHLTNKLKDEHEITLFEKNEKLFQETSYKNQNRLHLGYHYARSQKTRDLCLMTYPRFIEDYGNFVNEVGKNYYCVPKKDSLLDLGTYLAIFNSKNDVVTTPSELIDIEGCINTHEKHIKFQEIHDYFNYILEPYVEFKEIVESDINLLQKNYDLVIDCTNNHLLPMDEDVIFEPTISLIYERISTNGFDAITLVDGDLFSIYPYTENEFTLTDVTETPLGKFKTKQEMLDFLSKLEKSDIQNKLAKFENNVLKYYPFFLKDFTYKGYFISTKIKITDKADNRAPLIKQTENFIQCFTGKIQGVYLIEDYIKNIIINYGKTTIITPIQVLS